MFFFVVLHVMICICSCSEFEPIFNMLFACCIASHMPLEQIRTRMNCCVSSCVKSLQLKMSSGLVVLAFSIKVVLFCFSPAKSCMSVHGFVVLTGDEIETAQHAFKKRKRARGDSSNRQCSYTAYLTRAQNTSLTTPSLYKSLHIKKRKAAPFKVIYK